jgi:hypothetical protein
LCNTAVSAGLVAQSELHDDQGSPDQPHLPVS